MYLFLCYTLFRSDIVAKNGVVKKTNISDATFDTNATNDLGGAIYVEGAGRNTTLNIYGSTFGNNSVFATGSGKSNGGAIYYKGEDTHTHTFYTSYYLTDTNWSSFRENKIRANNTYTSHGSDICLENVTGESSIKYVRMNLGSDANHSEKNHLAIINSDGEVTISNSSINNINGTQIDTKEFSTIYVENSTLILDKAVHIFENINPIRLNGATLSMASYNFRAHGGTNGVQEEEDILLYNNEGDYVIGVDSSAESVIDLLVNFNKPIDMIKFMDLQEYLSKIFGGHL